MNSYQLRVKIPSGKIADYSIGKQSTVRELKEQIAERELVKVEEFKLIVGDKSLNDQSELENQNLRENALLKMQVVDKDYLGAELEAVFHKKLTISK